MTTTEWTPSYSPWRHGGWYVDNVRYASGAVGCVSRNYADRKWRIVCGDHDQTFPNRDAAARAEKASADKEKETWPRCESGHPHCGGYLHRDSRDDYYSTCWNCGIYAWGDKPGHAFRLPARTGASA